MAQVLLDEIDLLPATECWDRLRVHSVGRLALSIRALPSVLPVEYFIDGDGLAIFLGYSPVAAESVTGSVAAFAVDSIDRETSRGWSVQVLGRLSPVGGPDHRSGRPASQLVFLTPENVSGERIRLCPFPLS